MLPPLLLYRTPITYNLVLNMARLPISIETRRQLNANDRRWPIKLGLRTLAIPFALIAMILFAVTTSLSKLNYGGNDWTDGLPLAPVSCPCGHAPLETPSETLGILHDLQIGRLNDPCIICRSSSPSSTTLSSFSSLFFSDVAALSTLDGMSE